MTPTLHAVPKGPEYELVSIEHLHECLKQYIPPLEKRKALSTGDVVRIHARQVGGESVYAVLPLVVVKERTPTGYIGAVSDRHGTDYDWLPIHTRIVFTADNVCEFDETA